MADQRAALVTGTSTGIGNTTARALAQNGFVVFAGVRSEKDAANLASVHPGMRPTLLDVTDRSSISRSVDAVRDSGIPLYALVNNAGIAVGGPLEYLPLDELRRQFDVNVFGTIAVTQAALPLLRETRGRIVTIGSIASRFGAPLIGPYSASKAAIAVLMDSLRIELAPSGVHAILFEFAAVKTPIWAKARSLKEHIPQRLPPKAVEVYAPFLEAAFKQIDHEERVGLDPHLVAQAIVAAILAGRPRARYVVGRQAHIQAAVAVLPHRVRDNIVRKVLRIP
jgi:NAD(P)-dependent dehydrogenase (short-subunit alcohol dehydrogenase family)